MMWRNVTDTFAKESRYYKNTYMEICEVYDLRLPDDVLFDTSSLWDLF